MNRVTQLEKLAANLKLYRSPKVKKITDVAAKYLKTMGSKSK